MFGMIDVPPRVARWEQRTSLSAAEHLKAIDYDLDAVDRNHVQILQEVRATRTALTTLYLTIAGGIITAVVAAIVIHGL